MPVQMPTSVGRAADDAYLWPLGGLDWRRATSSNRGLIMNGVDDVRG